MRRMAEVLSGKIPTTAVESLVGIVGPDLAPDLLRDSGEGEDVCAGFVEVVVDLGQLVGHGVEKLVELGVYGLGVGLVVDAVQHRLHAGPGVLGADRHQVGGVVGAAALPGRPAHRGAEGRDESCVGI